MEASRDGAATLLYRSSNGDEWHWMKPSEPSAPFVLHRANLSSGGTQTRYAADVFLALGNGPEQQALRLRLASPA